MVYLPRNPLGFRNLRTWQQANKIYDLTKDFVASLPSIHPHTRQPLRRLIDHMMDSARSGIRNIEEGFKRATTKEYILFLGYSIGSLEELTGDYTRCQKDGIGNQEIIKKALPLLHGEDKMLGNQVASLEQKMSHDKTNTLSDRWMGKQKEMHSEERAYKELLKQLKLKRLEDGRVVPEDQPG